MHLEFLSLAFPMKEGFSETDLKKEEGITEPGKERSSQREPGEQRPAVRWGSPSARSGREAPGESTEGGRRKLASRSWTIGGGFYLGRGPTLI